MRTIIIRGHGCTNDFTGLPNTVKVITMPPSTDGSIYQKWRSQSKVCDDLERQVRESGCAVVVCTIWIPMRMLVKLRIRGVISKLIYWGGDWYPVNGGLKRRVIHAIFQRVLLSCLQYCDEVWHSCGEMRDAMGVDGPIVSPGHGCWPEVWTDEYDANRFVIVSPLVENQGIDVAIEALALSINYKLTIVGHGPMHHEYVKLAMDLKVSDRVTFTGYIKDEDELHGIVAKCCAGIALYSKDSHARFTMSGKVSLYIGCGIPVIAANTGSIESLLLHDAVLDIFYDPMTLSQVFPFMDTRRYGARRYAMEQMELRKQTLERITAL